MEAESAMRESDDVTALLCQASQQLRVGEMIHGPDFDLAKIMNAVEIGDPRLDAGIPSAESSGTEAAAAAELDTDLNLRQILDIMDYTMVLEATWYSGSNLAQTIYTCRYLLEQDKIKHLGQLSAFMDSSKALAKFMSDIIIGSGVASEEDIFAYNYGIDFGLPQEDLFTEPLATLQAAERNSSSKSDALGEQISVRLHFQHQLTLALSRISLNTKQSIEDGKKALYKALAELQKIDLEREPSASLPAGFVPDIHRQRSGPMASRKVTILSGKLAHQQFQTLLEELLDVCRIAKVTNWEQLNRFLDEFAQKKRGPIARSLLAALVVQSTQKQPWQPSKAMMQTAFGISQLDSKMPTEIESYFTHCHMMAQSMVQIKCMNRARQRRRQRNLTDDWLVLMNCAKEAESLPSCAKWLSEAGWRWELESEGSSLKQEGPLRLWVEKECCRTMLTHLYLGFELECYMPFEYSMIYWYCEHLLGILVENANLLALRFPPAVPQATGKKKLPAKPQTGLAKFRPQALDLLNQARLAQMERQLCRGYMRVACALYQAGDIQPRPEPFNSEEHVYEQRFFYFHALPSPTYMQYSDYALSTSYSGTEPSLLLRQALLNFQDARITASAAMKDNSSDVAQAERIIKVAKQNTVAVHLVAVDLEEQMKKLALQGAADVDISQIKPAWHVTWHTSENCFPLLSLSKV